jgi:predicted O-methyltransferase YrrM
MTPHAVSHAAGELSNREDAFMNALVSAEIEAYATAHSMKESEVCRAVRAETLKQMDCPQMIVGPLEGAFLKMVSQLVRATHVLEIGMFTGYSALCFAEALLSLAGISRRQPMAGRSKSVWDRQSRRCGRSTGTMTSFLSMRTNTTM